MKKIPQRTCIGCKTVKPKFELIRIVKSADNDISIDVTGKKNGRGAYICKDEECLNKIIKTKKLEKVFDRDISTELYESIRGIIIDK